MHLFSHLTDPRPDGSSDPSYPILARSIERRHRQSVRSDPFLLLLALGLHVLQHLHDLPPRDGMASCLTAHTRESSAFSERSVRRLARPDEGF